MKQFGETEALVKNGPLIEVSSDCGLEEITPNFLTRKYQAGNFGDKHKLLLANSGTDG